MIRLRVVGSSNDLENLILTSRKQGRRGSHVVGIDEKLFRVLEDVVRKRRARQKGEPVRRISADSKLAPREVQRLLRAGKPVEQVAKLAGVDVAWIERFLGPVLDERAVAIQGSQRARLEKPRLGLSSLPLGEAVARNLRARRVRITEEELKAAWDASRSDSQPWVISLTFPYRGREQRAVWRFDPRTGEVSAGNRLGSDVGWVADARRAAPSRTAGAARPRPAAKKKAAPRKKAAKKPAAGKRRAAPKRAATRRAPAKRRAASKRRAAPKRRATTKRRTSAKRRVTPKRTAARRAPKRGRR